MSSILYNLCIFLICTMFHCASLSKSDEGSKSKHKNALAISDFDIYKAIYAASDSIASLKTLEENLLNAQVADNYINILPAADSNTSEIEERAYMMEKATVYLMGRHCYKNFLQSPKCLKRINEVVSSEAVCDPPTIRECVNDEFRTLDGSCNHRSTPSMGATRTSYNRLLPADYLDGVQSVRRSALKKHALPSARKVIDTLVTRDDDTTEASNSILSITFAHWGEFIEHDMIETVPFRMVHFNNSIDCCTPDGDTLLPRHLHPKCDAIKVPDTDSFYTQYNVRCLHYVRSMTGVNADCLFGPIDQLNQATHYLDASHIYGTGGEDSQSLRIGGSAFVSPGYDEGLRTIFLLEHNRLARLLSELHPEWEDEKLFQETRRIVIAEIQHITYEEWLPVLFLKPLLDFIMDTSSYEETFDPRISNSFATAAIRFVQSMFTSRNTLRNETQIFNAFVRGLETQKSRKVDLVFASNLIDFHDTDTPGLDRISLDVQRGRDHGLPSYNAFLKHCGFPNAHTFNHFAPMISEEIITALSAVYKHPNDVDLIIGGLAEQLRDVDVVGPTFSCILADQFRRTRAGDRYFYEFAMSPEEIRAIRQMSLAKVLCENGGYGVGRMQRHAFLAPDDDDNPVVDCDEIDGMDLNAWKGELSEEENVTTTMSINQED